MNTLSVAIPGQWPKQPEVESRARHYSDREDNHALDSCIRVVIYG